MNRRAWAWLTALAAVATVALGLVGFRSGADPASAAHSIEAPGSDPAAQEGRPAHWPEHFGFGAPASPDRIALWDIDVKPDGEGLPSGSGSVADGQRVYSRMCRSCHGATGVEGPNDVLVGEGEWETWPSGRSIGEYWPYATTLFDYIVKAMPQKRPGTMTADQTYAVIAYLLYQNGLIAEDAVMDAQTLPAVIMPARDRFVPDNRTGGPVIR